MTIDLRPLGHSKNLTRRKFLIGSAAGAGAIAASQLLSNPLAAAAPVKDRALPRLNPVSNSGATTQTSSPVPFWSAYSGPANGGDPVLSGPSGMGLLSNQTTKTFSHTMDFGDGSSWEKIVGTTAQTCNKWQGQGYQLVYGLPMLPSNIYSSTGTGVSNSNRTSGNSSTTGFRFVAAGGADRVWTSVGKSLVDAGFSNAIIRIAWEFNLGSGCPGPWGISSNTWGQPNLLAAAAFIAAYRTMVRTLRAVPGQNFTFLWNPNRGDSGIGDLMTYYPGDKFVDWMGLDVYDMEWGAYPGMVSTSNPPYQEWSNMETQTFGLNWLLSTALNHNKRVAIPEWGAGFGRPACAANLPGGAAYSAPNQECGGGDNANFYTLMMSWCLQNNALSGLWNYGSELLSYSTASPYQPSNCSLNPDALNAVTTANGTPSTGGSGNTSSVVSIIQSAVADTSAGTLSLGSAPQNGNLLLAFLSNVCGSSDPNIPSGWSCATTPESGVGGEPNSAWVYKIATSSEPTSYSFSTDLGVVMYEMSNAGVPTTYSGWTGSWCWTSPVQAPQVVGSAGIILSGISIHSSPSSAPTAAGSGWTVSWSTGGGWNDAVVATAVSTATVEGATFAWSGATSTGGGSCGSIVVPPSS